MTNTETYVVSSALPVSVETAFSYHERPGALQRLIPPWEWIEVEQSDASIEAGSRVVLKTSLAGIPFRWVAEHTEYDRPNLFVDEAVSGPFRSWRHRHEFSDSGEFSILRDAIEYGLPVGWLGSLLGSGLARRKLETMFAYRHRVTRDDLRLAADHPSEPLTVAVSGSSGLVGSHLGALLTLLGHRVRPIVRSRGSQPDEIAVWEDESEARKLGEVDAVVHLAGRSVAKGRWTESVKREIRESRLQKTRALCESLASLERRPKVLFCASATGIYGDRGDEILDEDSETGEGFLAEVAGDWERACQPARDAGIRVVNGRLGLVLSCKDGALKKMLLPAKFAGGAVGNGKQWVSWIALDDVLGAIYHAIMTPSVSGPVNFVAPEPCTNSDFARTLASTVGRPALVPAPAFAMRMALGEMADALLLASTRVTPKRLIESGYPFRFTDLGDVLRYSLGKERLQSAE